MIKNILIAISILGLSIVEGGLNNTKTIHDVKMLQLSQQKEPSRQKLDLNVRNSEKPSEVDRNISIESFVKARKQARAMKAKSRYKMKAKAVYDVKSTSSTPRWTAIGKATRGRITDIVADPENPDTVYVGTALGGVWKSTNGGESYVPIFDNAGSLAIGALWLDPNNPDIIYVGTGDPVANSVYSAGDGLWRSEDGGKHWEHLASGSEVGHYISTVIVNPNNTNEIFVAGKHYVYRSRDNGKIWKRITDWKKFEIRKIQMDPDKTTRLYMSEYYGNSNLWKSEDSGDHWTKLPKASTEGHFNNFALAPSSPNVLYATYTFRINNKNMYKIYRSEDRGETWQIQSQIIYEYAHYCGNLIVSPIDKNTLYVLDVYMSTSIDGGKSFTYPKHHHEKWGGTDNHALWISPSDGRIYSGSDQGVRISDNSGDTFKYKQPLPIGQFYSIDVDPIHHRIFGGMQDRGTGYTTNGKDWHGIASGDGMIVRVDNNNSNIVYTSTPRGEITIHSFDSPGRLVSAKVPHGQWRTPYVQDPSSNLIYAAGEGNLYVETTRSDRKMNFTQLSSKDFGIIYNIDIPKKGKGNIIYMVSNIGAWLSINKGVTWEKINDNRGVYSIAVDPKNDATAYISTMYPYKMKLMKTTNYGERWIDISSNAPSLINDILIDPDYSSTLYCATGFGVYISLDAGTTWSLLGRGLPEIKVNELKFIKEGAEIVLYAGTYGRGIYSVRLTSKQRGGELVSLPTPPSNLTVTNLTTNSATLTWKDNSSNETGFYIYRSGSSTRIKVNANVHTYNLTGLEVAKDYTYSVKAYNSAGESSAATTSFKTKPAVFKKAHILSPTNGSTLTSSSMTVKWERNSASTTKIWVYDFVHHKRLHWEVVTGTSKTFTDLPTNGERLQVRLYSFEGNSFKGYETIDVTAKKSTPVVKPTSPSNLTVTNLTTNSATLNWKDNSNNETKFHIYKDGILVDDKVNANVHTYNLTGLTAAKDYTYSVKAYNSAGESSAATTSFKTKPAVFKKAHILSPTNGSTLTSSSMTIKLERNSANHIYIWVYDFVHHKRLRGELVTGTSKTFTDLPTNGERLQVRLYSFEGNLLKGSETIDVTAKKSTPVLKPTPPSNLTVTNITTNSATLTWKDNSNNETKFHIYKDGILVDDKVNANVHTYKLTGLTAAKDYTYSVKAYNSAGESSAATTSFKTKPAVFKKAHILSPTNGTTLTSSTVKWERNSASRIQLFVYDYTHKNTLYWGYVTDTSKTITNMPTNGEDIRITLHSYDGSSYKGKEKVHVTAKK